MTTTPEVSNGHCGHCFNECAECDAYVTSPTSNPPDRAEVAAVRDRERIVGYLIRFGHRIEAAGRWNGAHYEPAGPGGRRWPLDKAQRWADAALADERARQANPEPVCCDFADIAPCEVRTARCMPL